MSANDLKGKIVRGVLTDRQDMIEYTKLYDQIIERAQEVG